MSRHCPDCHAPIFKRSTRCRPCATRVRAAVPYTRRVTAWDREHRPPWWEAHLERLAERAAAEIPLFRERK